MILYGTYVPDFFEIVLVDPEQLASGFRAHRHVSGQVVNNRFAKRGTHIQRDNGLRQKPIKKKTIKNNPEFY